MKPLGRFSSLSSILVFVGSVSLASAECGDNSTPIGQIVRAPDGLGLRRIIFKHDRDENTVMNARVGMNAQDGSPPIVEEIRDVLLQNRDLIAYDVKNPILRNGRPGAHITIAIDGRFSGGEWPPRHDFKRLGYKAYGTYFEFSFWTGCHEERNTWAQAVYSNDPRQ